MYIHKIRLKNIRGFKDLEFSFDRGERQHAGWTVFLGDNGAGKSTVLKALAIALMGVQSASALLPSRLGWIRQGARDGVIEVDVMHKSGNARSLKAAFVPDGTGKTREVFLIAQMEPSPVFACGYGPFRRVTSAAPDVVRKMSAPVVERFVTLFEESATLAQADQWLRDLKYKSLEGKEQAARQLDVVLELFRDGLLPNQISIDRVDSDGLWLKDRQGTPLAWSDMSDGYRAALALLSDILRHLMNATETSELTARDSDGKLYITSQGVVLIDEIDAHLHPEWQREIGFWLKKHFPNIQFLVTSHSPLICQAADPNGLFVLPEPGSDVPARALTPEEYWEVVSSRPDTILRSAAFGLTNTRSDTAVEARAGYARLKAKERAGARLTRAETEQLGQLSLFVNTAEEP